MKLKTHEVLRHRFASVIRMKMLAHIASASQKFTPTFADAAGVVNDAAQM